jgi:hypothetical protein
MPSDCIEVGTGRTSKGYGSSYIRYGKEGRWHVMAHRFVYEQEHGPIPEGLFVCHTCDNPPCINVEHLFLGTPKDNAHDCIAKGRWPSGPREYCKRELHRLEGDNLYQWVDGEGRTRRFCRACIRTRLSEARGKKE